MSAVAACRMTHSYPFYMRDALGGRPIVHDSKADALRAAPADKVSVAAIGERLAMLSFAPATDKLVISRQSFRRHDERKIFACCAIETDRIAIHVHG